MFALIPQRGCSFVNPFGIGSQLGIPIASGVLSVRIPRKLGCVWVVIFHQAVTVFHPREILEDLNLGGSGLVSVPSHWFGVEPGQPSRVVAIAMRAP
ncbi:hypothetical protein [Nocardia sp. NPDC058633]|uniref:hypothetical protein n=1 Tax=Nocardia sp. NPDC058633 TaxID=3346568 RepID=UPI00365D15E9